jgi:uncharacterized protein
MRTQALLTKYELPLFFLLTYLLSWWSAPFTNGQILPHGPTLAALIILALTTGREELRDWWCRITHWRVAWYWFVISQGIVLGYQGVAFVLNLLLGATTSHPIALPSMGIMIELLLLGGLWEEPGWTGYALPKMLERYANRPNGTLIAALVLGVFRAVWHLPLFLYGYIQWFDILFFEIAIQLIIAWLYVRSSGSVPVIILFHFTSNILGPVMSPVFAGAARTNYYALFMALAALIAIGLYAWFIPGRPATARTDNV